jgi:CRISPR/Cas system-associated exonuclease Cas4 (RecB family)
MGILSSQEGVENIQIRHRSDMVSKFAEIMMEDFSKQQKDRTGLHRSDAITCPLKAYWRLTGKYQAIFTSQSVGILLIGTLAHLALHKNFDAKEEVHDLHGVTVTIDAITEMDGKRYPIESKTTRKKIYGKDQIPQEWFEQLAIAMGVIDADRGYLMILNVITYSMTVWEISMSVEEREMFLNGCIWQVGSILDAIKQGKPELLQPKYDMCDWCPYKPSRSREDGGCPFYKPKPRKD